jgi:ABC-2 type transport system ATP-binding protein
MELTIEGISKKYGRFRALRNATQTLRPGVYGLLGPNGAGKSTLMNIVAGVAQPSAGRVCYDGEDIGTLGARYRGVLGFMPQVTGYYRNFTARDFLAYVAALKGMGGKHKTKTRIEEMLAEVNLTDAADRKIGAYSGGMKQRLGIAQTLLNDPAVVVFDEPTAGLDPKERIRFKNLLSRIASEKIIILATHIVSDIESVADRIILLRKGEIILSGTVGECLSRVNGNVYHIPADAKAALGLIERHKVVGMSAEGGRNYLRVVSGTPPPRGVLQERVTLEDLYLSYFWEDET